MVWILNLEWVLLAVALCWLWVPHARREGPGRQVQFIALALVLANMFVVISMYDDMAMAQNSAETRCFQREDDFSAYAHAQLHAVAASTPPIAMKLPLGSFYCIALGNFLAPAKKTPFLFSIRNRPPPAV